MSNTYRPSGTDANRDPISGAPGSHPVGTAVGATAGAVAAGAAVGSVAGPVGTVVGGVIGAIVGGAAGKTVAEQVDPTVESAYWRDNYSSRDYVRQGSSYDDYGPAYDYGVESFRENPARDFSDVEGDLSRDWDRSRGSSSLGWNEAKHATRDSWQRLSDRIERAVPGDSDRDGK